MMTQAHTPFRKRQAGFTLLELLLSVGLLGLLLAGIYGILNSWTERAINRQAASDMLRLRTAAHDFVLGNFETFRTVAPGQFFEIPVATLRTESFLPSAYTPINAFRQEMRVFHRNLQTAKLNPDGSVALDGAGNTIMLTTIEVVVVSDDPPSGRIRIPNKRLLDTANAGGPAMGVIADLVMPNLTFTNLVTSTLNQWFVQLSALSAAGYTSTPDAVEGGYLATYDLVSSESSDANDDWLYRVPVDGRPELNRMATDLNMNANQLQNVGTIIADKYTIEGNAAFRGQAQGGATETAQGMTVEQALRVDSGNDIRFNMKTSTGGCSFSGAADGGNRTLTGSGCTMSGGEIQTVGEGRAGNPAGDATMNVVDSLRADGNVITDFTDVDQTTNVAGIATFDTVTGTTMNTTTTVLAPTTQVEGANITTQQYQTGNMGVSAGATITNQLVAARAAAGMGFTFETQQLTVGNTVELQGNLGAEDITATDVLYLDNARVLSPGDTTQPGFYNDPSMNNRLVECVSQGGRTYCEPRGRTYYVINGKNVRDWCWDNGGGYTCTYDREVLDPMSGTLSYQPFGECRFTRSVTITDGRAYEDYECT